MLDVARDVVERGELKYRLALRGSFYLGDDKDRRNIFDLLRRAYDVRSAVAHGGQPSKKTLKGQTLGELTQVTEEMMRRGIGSAVRTGKTTPPLVDWTELIVG